MAVEMMEHADGSETLAAKAAKLADKNGDNMIDCHDCPYPSGTPEAKQWIQNELTPYLKSQVTPEMKAKYGDKVTGAYHGKPLVPGVKGSAEDPQGDFELMSDKIQVTQNVPKELADKVAARIMYTKYPKVVS
jgi:hypothetical protein